MDEGAVVVVESTQDGKLTQRIEAGSHLLFADEQPPTGDDRGPTPYEYLLAALGACTSMTMRMYAENNQWPLEGVSIRLTYNRDHVKDCVDGEEKTTRVHRFEREIRLDGDLSDDQKERLKAMAERCAVHRTMVEEKEIVTTLI
jgi:putative redox protein